MFGSKKEPKEKPQYTAYVGLGGGRYVYRIFEYRLLDNGIVELRTDGHGMIALMPGTSCMIEGGEWNSSSE